VPKKVTEIPRRPKPRVSRFFCALRCPRFNRQTPARGKGAGGLECHLATWCAVLESKADMQKRGQASPDDGDALALTFAQPFMGLRGDRMTQDVVREP
jgi:hypothetical protein